MMRSLVIAAMLCLAGPGFAAEFDIDAYCRIVSKEAPDRETAEQACRDREKDYRQKVRDTSMPSDVERQCTEAATSVGGSYRVLYDCAKERIADGLD